MARNISKESLEQKIAKIEKEISKDREQNDRLTQSWRTGNHVSYRLVCSGRICR